MRGVGVAPEALADLAAIRRYTINGWGVAQARRYLGGLGDLFKNIAARRATASTADHIRKGYKRARYQSHVIFFVEDEAEIRIIRVLHVRMDFEAHL